MNLKSLGLAFGAVAFSMSAHAQSPKPDAVVNFIAGEACAFPLRISVFGGVQVNKEFVDRSGRVVRTLAAGKGSTLIFENITTQAQLTTRPNGSVYQERINQDGSYTATQTGHNVLILYPSDVPAGPTTTQYVGRVVYTVDPSGVFTLQQVSGRSTDICDALS